MTPEKTITINGQTYLLGAVQSVNGHTPDENGNVKIPAAEGAVLYTEQTLTDEQKAQARANIGAADDTFFESFEVGGSNNILPPDYESGYYSPTDGKPGGHSNHIRTPSLITIMPNSPIFVTTNGLNDNTDIIILVLYYDENDNFISTSTIRRGSFNATGYKTPANAVKMNVSFNNAVPAGGTMADVCISYTQLAAFEPYSVAHTQKVVKEEALPENVTASAKAWANANLYVYFDGTNCYVKSKYSKTEDLVVRIAKGGGNNLPDIRQVYTVANLGYLNNELSVSRNFYSTQSDHIGPQKVAAVNNVDGDAPDTMYFTGGSHQTNNQTSGGAATARNDGFVVLADNVQLANNSGVFCEKVRLHWTNYIQGYNTSKDDGTGREILKEDVAVEFSNDGITVDVCHKALEDVIRHLWYGLQGIIGIFEKIRFIGGSNRLDNDVTVASDSGDNKCRTIVMHNSLGDYAEIGICDIDIGDFSLNTVSHSAHTPTSKCYFNIIRGNGVEQKTNETTFLRGYYRFKKTL